MFFNWKVIASDQCTEDVATADSPQRLTDCTVIAEICLNVVFLITLIVTLLYDVCFPFSIPSGLLPTALYFTRVIYKT